MSLYTSFFLILIKIILSVHFGSPINYSLLFVGCIADMLTIFLSHGGSLPGLRMAYIGRKVLNMGDVDPDHLTLIDIVYALT